MRIRQTALYLLVSCWLLLAPVLAKAAAAQTPPPPNDSARKFEITDNSFLVEEAFNQEARIFQNIVTWAWTKRGEWEGSFTQEWPLGGMTHQFSYTIPFSSGDGDTGVNDVLINYRYQWWNETYGRPAISPRLSVVLPTGNAGRGLGNGTAGLEINIPVSKQFGDLYVHGNAGLTWLPRVAFGEGNTRREHLTSPRLAASGIWRVTPMFNLMLEAVAQFEESVENGREIVNERAVTLSPGFRRGWNVGAQQLVMGVAVPVALTESGPSTAAFTYFSYELPF